MSCKIPYIQNQPLSETEKSRLEEVHVSIFSEAKKSGVFRTEDNRLVTLKQGYAKATEFIKVINDRYREIVATLPSVGGGKHTLNVNVLPLSSEKQLPLLQKEGVASVASEDTIKKIEEVAKKMGVDLQDLASYAKKTGLDATTVNGVADLVRGIIAIAEGKEGQALTEEMVHIATAILEQTNPQLVTEMISKITRFKIYNITLENYKNDKNYQLPNGKPDIRKIKKEAVDKLIAEVLINKGANTEQFPELRQEENMSIVERMWNAILDFFKGAYRKADINLFEEAAEQILEGVGNVSQIKSGGVYFQISPNKAVDDIYNKIIDIDSRMVLVPQLGDKKRHYKFDGEDVAKSVTEKVKESQNMPDRTDEQKAEDDQKRTWGLTGHEYIANYIKENLIDENGYALATPKNEVVETSLNKNVKTKLDLFAQELIKSYKPGTRFIIEKKVVNEKYKGMVGSTMDFVAIEPDKDSFKMDIYDWKFMNVNTSYESDVPWYKKKEWNSQMGEYTQIMYNYGVKPQQLKRARMIPFQANYVYSEAGIYNKKEGELLLQSIEIGNLDPTKEPNLYLLPVALDTEKSGDELVDKLTGSLRQYYNKIFKIVVSAEEQSIKNKKLNEIASAIRALHLKQDFAPLIEVGSVFLKSAELVFKRFENIDYTKLTDSEIDKNLTELLEIQESAGKFASLDEAFLKHFPRKNLTSEQQKILLELERVSASTRRMMDKLQDLFDNYVVYKANKEGFTTEETKESILEPEMEIGNFAKMFLEGSKLSSKIIKLGAHMLLKARSLADITTNNAIKQFTPMLLALEKEASAVGKTAFQMIGTVEKGKLELISKIDKDFKSAVYKARKDKNQEFFQKNVDKAKYKELAEKAINRRIEEESKKDFVTEEKKEIVINRIKNSLNLYSKNFNGFEDYDFRRIFWESLIEEPHLSKEYKEMSTAAKAVWQFFTDLNIKAKKMGYLTPTKGLSFFPLMEATILEKLSNANNKLKESGDILKDLYTVRKEEEYQYSKIDEETGQLKKEIPKLFTRTNKDVQQLSTDLNKVAVLWVKALAQFETSKAIESSLLVMHAVEKNKGSIITDAEGKPIFEAGAPRTVEQNEKNADAFQTIIDDGLYGLNENLSSLGNLGLSQVTEKLAGDSTEERKEELKLSTKKGLNNMNKLVQSLAVGLKFLVAIPNYFGFQMQAAINAGRFITFKEFEKNNLRITAHTAGARTISDIELALLDKMVPLNEDITQEARRSLAKKEGFLNYIKTWSFHDVMMVTNSFPDRLLQFANAMSFIENTMVVDGKLVNIRQFLRAEDRRSKAGMPEAERRALEDSFEERVKALKEEKSIIKTAVLSENDITIPGVSDEEIAAYRVKIIEYGRKMSGQMNQNNKADYRRDTILKSFMMFKGWIPKQVSLRTLDIHKDMESGEWEYGRTRAFIKVVHALGLRNIANIRDIMIGTDRGLEIINKLYQEKKEAYYLKTGQQLEITEEEFQELIRTEVVNQMKELAFLIGLVGLVVAVKAAEPPEDEEDTALINRYKFWAKASNKIADELFFYYNPLSFESMTRGSVLPAMGLLSKAQKFFYHLTQETYGVVVSDEDLIEKSHPFKYFLNLMPVASQIQNEIMPIIDPEWAKEQGIRVTSEPRQK